MPFKQTGFSDFTHDKIGYFLTALLVLRPQYTSLVYIYSTWSVNQLLLLLMYTVMLYLLLKPLILIVCTPYTSLLK